MYWLVERATTVRRADHGAPLREAPKGAQTPSVGLAALIGSTGRLPARRRHSFGPSRPIDHGRAGWRKPDICCSCDAIYRLTESSF